MLQTGIAHVFDNFENIRRATYINNKVKQELMQYYRYVCTSIIHLFELKVQRSIYDDPVTTFLVQKP